MWNRRPHGEASAWGGGGVKAAARPCGMAAPALTVVRWCARGRRGSGRAAGWPGRGRCPRRPLDHAPPQVRGLQPPPQQHDQADHGQDQADGEQAGPGRALDGVAVVVGVVGPLGRQTASRWQTGQRRRAAFRSTRSWRRPSARVNPQVVQLAIHQSSSRCRAGGLGGVGSRPGRCRSGLTAGDFGCIGVHSLVPAPGALPARGGSM